MAMKDIRIGAAQFENRNGDKAYNSLLTVGPVTFSKTDREGVDSLQLYVSKGGVFYEVGKPFESEYVKKIK